MSARPSPSERTIILLIAAVQFVNILDFVIVMPMGPDFAKALAFDESRIGWLAGAYTGAAALSGLAGSFFLDRFDRRPALLVSLVGLVLATAAGGLAWDLPSLMAARVLAGLFGGPATSVAFSIIADVVPPDRRGKAMGIVMGAFGAASVLGVPLGLMLARLISWQAPFVTVALFGAAVIVLAVVRLPSMRGHIAGAQADPGSARELLADPLVLFSYLMTATVMLSGFIVIPNISAYLQENLQYPRSRIELLYMVGGTVSFIIVPLIGRLVDRFGSMRVGSFGSFLLIAVVFIVFYREPPPAWPVMPFFVWFMVAMGFRNVAYNTLTTKVPRPNLRARFMSLQSTVQHAASALGGFLAGSMLHKQGERMEGMPTVAAVSMALSLVLPLLLATVEAGVRRRAALTATAR